LRVRGKGLPNLRGGHGDLIAHVLLWVPGKVTAQERKLLEELRALGEGRVPRPGRSAFQRVRDAFAV
jgi:DnaJ-class molecular chaperone